MRPDIVDPTYGFAESEWRMAYVHSRSPLISIRADLDYRYHSSALYILDIEVEVLAKDQKGLTIGMWNINGCV